MQHCRDEKEIKRLIAHAMQSDNRTNPNGYEIQYFENKLSQIPLTNELISQWLWDPAQIPETNRIKE